MSETRVPLRDSFAGRPTTLADYLAILRRRKAILIALPLIAAASAYVVAHGQKPLYQSTAQVLVNRSSIVSAITNVVDPTIGDPERFLTTQASIARSPELAARVASVSRISGLSADGVLNATSVRPEANADVLDIAASWATPAGAEALANSYANEFTRYKTLLDTRKVDAALVTLGKRIAGLQAKGANQADIATLLQYQTQLETIGTLLANNTSVLQQAQGASKIRPRPKRTALLGALLGGVFALGLAFLIEALDRRVRSEDEIEAILGLPLLGRVPRPPRHLRDGKGLVMLAEPSGVQAEAIRKLRTSLDFVNLGHDVRTIMVTSPGPGEGKSTTVANLAVAFARAGQRVALVDLDLRNPSLHNFFRTSVHRGVTDVAMGTTPLSEALRKVPLPVGRSFHPAAAKNGSSAPGAASSNGQEMLHVLPTGTIPPSAADFLESNALGTVLAELSTRFDVVLLDTPPVLAAGDAMALTARVDAVMVVLRVGAERPLLEELTRQLNHSRARVVGFVRTGVDHSEGYGYPYAYGYGGAPYGTANRPKGSAERV